MQSVLFCVVYIFDVVVDDAMKQIKKKESIRVFLLYYYSSKSEGRDDMMENEKEPFVFCTTNTNTNTTTSCVQRDNSRGANEIGLISCVFVVQFSTKRERREKRRSFAIGSFFFSFVRFVSRSLVFDRIDNPLSLYISILYFSSSLLKTLFSFFSNYMYILSLFLAFR